MTSPKPPQKFADDETLIAHRLESGPNGNFSDQTPADAIEVPRDSVILAERFALLALIAQGGMGTIHKARDLLTGATVALKQIRTEHVDSQRFLREALVLAKLSHPSIVRYIAHGISTYGTAYLAMEWLDGHDLSTHLRQGPLPVPSAATLVAQVADALALAHRQGVVHRDLKPSNIVLLRDPQLRAKLIDFGIARVAEQRTEPLTATGSIIGTPGYMSPEQITGDRSIGPQSDVFSLGCVLYECLTGTAPFSSANVHAILAGIMLDTPASARSINPEVPQELDALIGEMIAKDPQHRPDGMAAVVKRLRAHAVEHLPLEIVSKLYQSPATLTLSNTERRLSCAVGVQCFADATSADPSERDSAVEALRAIAHRFAASLASTAGCFILTQPVGGPLADQAARAARMALAIQAEVHNTTVTIAAGRSGGANERNSVQSAVTAMLNSVDAANTAEFSQRILIDATVASLLESNFVIARDRATTWLTGVQTDSKPQRLIMGRATPCVGREPELALLDASFKSCIEDETSSAVLLIGSAGSGKSRIRLEFVRRLEQQDGPVFVWMGRGDMVRVGSPFAILVDSLRNAIGFVSQEDQSEEQQLFAWVSKFAQPADVERIVTFIGDLLGCRLNAVRTAQAQAARTDPLLLGDQRQRALQELLFAVTKQQPVLWVLEDLQWADQPTINLLDGLLRAASQQRFMLLVTARPEVDELFSRLWHERAVQRVRVGPISQKAAEKVVKSVLGSQAKPDVVATLVHRASGHPLHLEELLRASVERGTEQLPDTALALIEARIDALSPVARQILRAASVFGRTFWQEPLRAMIGADSQHDVDHWLQELTNTEWIRPGVPQGTYEFLQDSVQETAYAMLTDEDQKHGHLLAGRWLEHTKDTDPLVLVRHFELGGDAEHAAEYGLQAAKLALAANDFSRAIVLCTRLEKTTIDRALLGQSYAVLAEAHYCLGSLEDGAACAAQALELVTEQQDGFFGAAAVYVNASGKLGAVAPVRTVGARLLKLVPGAIQRVQFAAATEAAIVQLAIIGALPEARALLDHARQCLGAALDQGTDKDDTMAPAARAAARGHLARAASAVAVFGGDPGAGIPHMQEAVDALEEAGNQRLACSMKKTLGWHLGEYGLLEESETVLRNSVATAERLGLQNLAAHARYDLVSPVLRQQKYEEALALVDGACTTFRAHNDRRLLSGAYAIRAVVLGRLGQTADALQSANEAESYASAGVQRFVIASARAEILTADGQYQAAVEATDEGLAALSDGASAEEGVTQLWLARAESLDRLGRHSEARQALRKIYTDLRQRSQGIADTALRAQFSTRIAENARVLALAKEWFGDEIDAV